MRRSFLIAFCLLAGATVITAAVTTGTDEARATLPPSLEKSLSSSGVERSVEVDPDNARKVLLEGGTEVFLVPGHDGDACIGLKDGSAACGPAADVAMGRLFLITVPANAEQGLSAIPTTGSAKAVVYGYQPGDRAARASVLGTERQVLGSGDVVEGVYRVKITTDAHSRRMTEVRFDTAGDTTQAPAPINLDTPENP